MKQIIQSYKTGEITLEEVPIPFCKLGGVLVKNHFSLISPGTERLMIETGKKSLFGKTMARPDLVRLAWEKAKREGFLSVFKEAMSRLDEPVPLGYSSSGVVVEAGKGVTEFQAGDQVACAGSGFASHAEYVWVPENLCVPINQISSAEASFVMLGAIALHGIRSAQLTPGEMVAVIGLGLIGLLTVQILNAYGFRVSALDIDKRKCEKAKEISPPIITESDDLKFKVLVEQITKGVGADAVIVASGAKDNKALLLSEEICRKRGRIVLVGMADISLTRKTMWEKEISFIVSKAAGPGSLDWLYEKKGLAYPMDYVRWTEKRNMEEFLRLVAEKRVDVKSLVTHRFRIEEALKAYEMILKREQSYIGILLEYGEEEGKEGAGLALKREVLVTPAKASSFKNVGLIGGGLFTKNILLPKLKKMKDVNLVKVATTSGPSANHLAKKFGFVCATTDYKSIIEDESIGRVIITTPHNLHGQMVLEALRAGKHVFVEKPLCLNEEELEEIRSLYNSLLATLSSPLLLMVGFNRVFSSLTAELLKFLQKRKTPLLMHYRVNSGYLPSDHWTLDKEIGGGRIVGEVCHFIDYLHYLCGHKPVSVFTESIAGETGKFFREDNLAMTLKFEDGSIGNIIYTAKGSKAFSRERLEVFCEEEVGVIEDFRKITLIRGGKKKRIKKFTQDLGYEKELEAFLENDSFDLQLFNRYYYSMLATFKAVESLKERRPIQIK